MKLKKTGVWLNLEENLENSNKNTNHFVNILPYADDIVLLTSNEDDMHFFLEIWCSKWRLEVNLTKYNVMHVC